MNGIAGKALGLALAALPTVMFVVGIRLCSLTPAIIAAGVSAALAFAIQLVRRAPLRPALAGLAFALLCVAVVAVTGDARDFFLVPTAVPFAVILVCVGSELFGRPIAGVIINPLIGGPRRWWEVSGLRRIYGRTNATAVLINVLNALLQVHFYVARDTAALGVIHVATGPVFATLVAVAMIFARRDIKSSRREADRPSSSRTQ